MALKFINSLFYRFFFNVYSGNFGYFSCGFLCFFVSIIDSIGIIWVEFYQAGNAGGYNASETASKSTQPIKIQPIEVPAISLDELKEVTDNFETNSLIGEGSYGRVYYGVLKIGQAAAIKKLDASKQPDNEFLAQVLLFVIQNCCIFHLVEFF